MPKSRLQGGPGRWGNQGGGNSRVVKMGFGVWLNLYWLAHSESGLKKGRKKKNLTEELLNSRVLFEASLSVCILLPAWPASPPHLWERDLPSPWESLSIKRSLWSGNAHFASPGSPMLCASPYFYHFRMKWRKASHHPQWMYSAPINLENEPSFMSSPSLPKSQFLYWGLAPFAHNYLWDLVG